MRAWIEPDPDYWESDSNLSIEVFEDNSITYGYYCKHRRLPWSVEIPDDYAQ